MAYDKITIRAISNCIEQAVPLENAMDYDNVGLLVGDGDQVVTGVLVALELTDLILEEAISKDCNLILVHHPLIFNPLHRITKQDPIGNRIIRLIEHQIGLYACHTNLDSSYGGLNDFVADVLGIKITNLKKYNWLLSGESSTSNAEPEVSNIRVGLVERQTLAEFVKQVKERLNLDYIHYCGEESAIIKKVGLCTGSGVSFFQEALRQKVDVYVTGDMKYHDAMMALDQKTPIIDATHYGTEQLVSKWFLDFLQRNFSNLQIIESEYSVNPIKLG